jgi:putative aldouronate transport system substrate-binding protein
MNAALKRLACAGFVAALLAGGYAEGKTTANEPGWKKDTSPVDFSWYVNFSWYPNKWGEDLTSRYVTKKTGVNVNFVVPAGNEAEKLNIMIASNTLPDVITLGWYEDAVQKLIDGGLVYSLTDLADKYDPYFYKVASPSRLGWYKQKDGKVYAYPNASYATEDYGKYPITASQTLLVRKDMYEAIGKPDMRTPEGFLKALRLAKEKFPEVNGQPLIPLGMNEFTDTGNSSLQEYLANFLAFQRERGGKYLDPNLGLDDPEYVRWLKAFRAANEQGLLAKDVFIDKRVQMEEKIAQGRYFCMIFPRTDLINQQLALYKADKNSVYVAVDGMLNGKLERPRLAGPSIAGWTVTLISKKCKNPDRAIKFVSYWLSEEGQRDFAMGVPDVMYTVVNGKDTWLPEVEKCNVSDPSTFSHKYGADNNYWMLMDSPMFSRWDAPLQEPLKQMEDWTKDKTVSYAMYDNINPPADSTEGLIRSKIEAEWGRTVPKLLLAKTDADFNALWKAFQAKKAKLGYDKVQAYQTKMVQANKVKLGIK